MPGWVTAVDGIEFESNPAATTAARPAVGVGDGRPYLKVNGQTANTVAGNVANQAIGTLAVPAIAVNVVGTIALSNTLITANSFIFLSVRKVGTDSSTSRGPVAWVDAIGAGTATIGVKAEDLAISASVYVVHYLIINY